MTSLVMGIAGAVVGSFFGMPELGWIVGSTLGSILDPVVITSEGPRLADLKVQTSTWGKMIPIVYGRARVAGNVIWSSDIRETKHTDDSGKGGPQQETIYYTYAMDAAVSICAGPVFGIRKIWANNKLIYNNDPSAGPQTLIENDRNDIFIYTGTETQLPDPTLEADKGVGNVPAYRGQCYVVFTDFQLADYGNRIPNFEFEVVQKGVEQGNRELAALFNTGFALDGKLSLDRRRIVLSVEDGVMRVGYRGPSLASEGVSVLSLDGRFLGKDYYRQRELALQTVFPGLIGFTDDFHFHIAWDPKPSPNVNFHWTQLNINGVPWYPTQFASNEMVWGASLSADKKVITLFTRFFTNALGAVSSDGKWYQFRTDKTLIRSGIADPSIGTIENLEPGAGAWYATKGAICVESDYDYIWATNIGYARLFKIQPDGSTPEIYLSGISTVYPDHASYAENGVLITYHETYFRAFSRIPSVSPTTVPLKDIVLDQCTRAGIASTDVDATNLTDAVTGFIVGSQTSARSNLVPLQKTYFFDSVESEGLLKFKKRGGVPVVTIPYDDLAAQNAPANADLDPLSITRMQEADLPVSMAVKFYDGDGDYQVGTEQVRRLIAKASQQVTEELAVVLTKDKAAQVSEALMYEAHISRTGYQLQLSPKYAYLEPTDVILVQTPIATYRMRIVRKSDDSGLLKLDAVADDATIYTSTAVGGTKFSVQTNIGTPGTTKLEFLDIPILRDGDNDAGMYVAMTGYLDAWKGSVLYRANDNLSFVPAGTVQNPCIMGVTATVLGNWSGQNFIDESSTVDVSLISGTLSSVPAVDLLAGANAAIIGNEIVQFRNATLIAPNKYRLTGMLRARYGTEIYTGSHAAGERFLMLGQAGTLRINEGASAINAIRYYKAVSAGLNFAKAGSYPFANTARGLKPLRPVHFYATRLTNNDWNLRWVRRTRVDGTWRDFVDAALGETTESYEVEIMNGAAVVRTIASSTPTVTYTAAQQNTDFGSVRTTITARLYQLSATVGRSDVLQQTFP
jgi:hypothetical protein